MALFGDDSDREQFFEAARLQALKEFEENPSNVQALVRVGGAMLELAHYKQGDDSTKMITDAIEKLKQAIALDPERTDAHWCMGNAFTSLGFLSQDKSKALQDFDRAKESFKLCQEKEPSNETYKKALEMCERAPEYYDEIQTHIAAGNAAGGSSDASKKAGSSQISEVWWDIGGWVILGAVVVGALMLARTAPKAAA